MPNISRKQIRESLTDGLDQLYKITSTYSDSFQDGSRTRLAAATAVSLFGASLDKLNRSNSLSSTHARSYDATATDNVGTESLIDENEVIDNESTLEDENIDLVERQEIKRQMKINKQENHFIDVLLEKLLLHAMPSNVPDKEDFEKMINNPLRKETEPLSISLFTSNIRKSTANLGDFFRFQWFLVKVFNWSNPALTFMFLICYTIFILYPYVIFVLPLVHIIVGTMIPAFLYRHPLHKVELLDVRSRGDSLLNKFFCQLKDEKLFEQFIQDEKDYEREEMKQRMLELDEQLDEHTKMLRQNMEFWVNMRDLQNAMTKMNKISDSINRFFYCTAAFKDERASTVLFFKLSGFIFTVLYFGKYFPWKLFLIFIMWFRLIKSHPKIQPIYEELKLKILNRHNGDLDKMAHKTRRADIIIDEPPEIKTIEIFEIYFRSLTNLNAWVFISYCNSEYLPQDQSRKLHKLPPGVTNIQSVKAPKSWKFHTESWNIDYDTKKWCDLRNIDVANTKDLHIDQEFLLDGEFKRRRLYREVIRYSRPAKKPPILF